MPPQHEITLYINCVNDLIRWWVKASLENISKRLTLINTEHSWPRGKKIVLSLKEIKRNVESMNLNIIVRVEIYDYDFGTTNSSTFFMDLPDKTLDGTHIIEPDTVGRCRLNVHACSQWLDELEARLMLVM